MNVLTEKSGYIKKHKKYIDYRTSLINDYVSLNESKQTVLENLVYSFIKVENEKKFIDNIPESAKEAFADLNLLFNSWNIIHDGDLAGYIYQSFQSSILKKQKGQFFTHDDIVNYIVKGSLQEFKNNYHEIKILDPACGSGQFLIGYYQELFDKLTDEGFPGKKIPGEIIKNLYGFDTDKLAVAIAKSNLAKISGLPVDKINIFENDFLDKTILPFYKNNHKFNIVSGNPPWGSRLKESQKNYYKENYKSSETGINTFTLFIERASDFITGNGRISFLLPEAFLNIKAHMASRKLVLKNFAVEEIAMWGEKFKGVFAPSISILLRKDIPGNISSTIVKINSNRKSEKNIQRLIPQQSYINTHENIFNINYSTKSVEIINRIENADSVFLKNKAKFFLGIVTGDNNKLIADTKSVEYPDPIVIGRDIEQYKINFSNHFFKFDTENLQQVAPLNLYKARNKILYKFIGKKLTFARDNAGYFTLNNVNGFIPEIPDLDTDCLVAILNSRIMQYYYEKSFFTVKVLKGNLEKLPIKIPDKTTQKRISFLSINLNKPGKSDSSTRENIEDIIQHIYGVKDKEAYSIDLPFQSSGKNQV